MADPSCQRRMNSSATGRVRPLSIIPAILCCLSAFAVPDAVAFEDDLLFVDLPPVAEESKYRQKISRAPSWTSVVTSDEIRLYGYRTLVDILDSVPGLYANRDRFYDSIGARGFGDPEDFSTRLLLMLDGVRINDGGLLDSAAIDRHFLLDVDNIERIEISRGPGSSLYGNNALTAVVNIITSRGRDVGGVEVHGSYGSKNIAEGSVAIGERRSRGFEYLLTANHYNSYRRDAFDYPEFNAPEFNGRFRTEIDEQRDSNVQFKLGVGDFSLHAAFSERFNRAPSGQGEPVFQDPGFVDVDTAYYINLTHDRSFGNDIEWRGDLYVQSQDYDARGTFNFSDPAGPEPSNIVNSISTGNQWTGFNGKFVVRRFDRHELIVGFETRYNSELSRHDSDREQVYYDDDRSSWVAGAYAQDRYSVRDDLHLFAGIRHDELKGSISHTTPRLGLVWNVDDATALKLLYSSAFRAPNIYELYSPDFSTGDLFRNDVDPEKMRTYELVVEHNFSDDWQAAANLFQFKLSDVIDVTFGEGDAIPLITNLSETQTTEGIDLALDGRFANDVKLQLGLTLQRSENDDGAELLNSPDVLGKLGVLYPVVPRKLTAAAALRYVGERKADDIAVDPHATTDLTLTAQDVGPGVEVQFQIANAFDSPARYVSFSEDAQSENDWDGRRYRLSLRYRF